IGIVAITLVYCHLSARLPVTGYAYQWSGRLVNRDYGWFTGWMALLAFTAGTAGIAVAIGSVFGPIFIHDPSRRQVQLLAAVMIVGAVLVNAIGVRAATWVNNVGATAELLGTLGLAAITLIALPFLAHKEGPKVLWQTGPVGGAARVPVAVRQLHRALRGGHRVHRDDVGDRRQRRGRHAVDLLALARPDAARLAAARASQLAHAHAAVRDRARRDHLADRQ